jgi:hypothetical protein
MPPPAHIPPVIGWAVGQVVHSHRVFPLKLSQLHVVLPLLPV